MNNNNQSVKNIEKLVNQCETCGTTESIVSVKVFSPLMGWDFQTILCPVCAFKKGLEHGELLTKYMITSKNKDKGEDKTQ